MYAVINGNENVCRADLYDLRSADLSIATWYTVIHHALRAYSVLLIHYY